MNDQCLPVGLIFEESQDNRKRWRIIESRERCMIIQININKFIISSIDNNELYSMLMEGRAKIIKEENHIIDYDKLSSIQKNKLEMKKIYLNELIGNVNDGLYWIQSNEKRHRINQVSEKYNISIPMLYKYLRVYLQGNFDINELIRKSRKDVNKRNITKKVGKKGFSKVIVDEKIEEMFSDAVDFYLRKKYSTITEAYGWMIDKYYLTNKKEKIEITFGNTKALVSEIPTIRQFRYWINKNTDRVNLLKAKIGEKEYENNHRYLASDTILDVEGPGILYEVDEMEMDCEIVSRINRQQVIGRPILYFLIDVYSKAIVAFSVDLYNNSTIGLKNLLFQIGTNLSEESKKNDVESNQEFIKFEGVLPQMIRSDRGAEYLSNETKKLFERLNIVLSIVPGAKGSAKGNVEKAFDMYNISNGTALDDAGAIRKEYGSNHKMKASMTIDDVNKIVWDFVERYNCRYMAEHPLKPEMIMNGIPLAPNDIWKYGVEKYGQPRTIPNRKQFCIDLLKRDRATVNRKGVIFNKLYYQPDCSYLYNLALNTKKNVSIKVLIDDKNLEKIYFIYENELYPLTLNYRRSGMEYFKSMTYIELIAYNMSNNENDSVGLVYNILLDTEHRKKVKEIVYKSKNERKKHQGITLKNKKDDIKYARKLEKELLNISHPMSSQLEGNDVLKASDNINEITDKPINEINIEPDSNSNLISILNKEIRKEYE